VPLELPDLDDLRWEDLLEEGRTLIPAWAPEWTNHNPSDPGITLMEMFAYFSEKLMYQLNRIGDKNVLEFLQLINGPEWGAHQIADQTVQQWLQLNTPTGWELHAALAQEKQAVLTSERKIRRAVSPTDFETLAEAVADIARAKCIAQRNLESVEPDAHTTEAPGHITVVVVPKKGVRPSRELMARVKRELEPARLLTTRLHVVGPRYLSLKCQFTIVPQPGTPAEGLKKAAVRRLETFFDPFAGGLDGKGWPLGGNIYLSEFYRVLKDLPGTETIMPARDLNGALLDEIVVEQSASDRARRNSRGEIEAVLLRADELVDARIDSGDISISHHP
jgi:baseplate J-like protein